ncbi:hypothetical protein GCM10010430_51070 [Kitasatospora cystarginea]|uniref:Uncharacterized protein n=1 Tax=Kitasatospora cystarginea TaxID=58350 RepID=A0ABN3EJZ0_9ACTN
MEPAPQGAGSHSAVIDGAVQMAGWTVIRLPEGSRWDWEIVAWDVGQLRLGAGHDLTYHHGLEPCRSSEPPSVSCPATFIRTRTQPTRRHDSDSPIRTACTRPGGAAPGLPPGWELRASGAARRRRRHALR